MASVYAFPTGLVTGIHYSPPTIVRTTRQWNGAPGQKVEHVQRSTVDLSGKATYATAADFYIMLDRLRGGINLVGLWDMKWRIRNGYPSAPTVDSAGAETFDGRSTAVSGTGSAGSVSLSITGLNAGEVVPRGGWIRIGDYRHRVRSKATADGAGAASLVLASPLRAAVSGTVTIPGDLFVGTLVGRVEIGKVDANDVREFRALFSEVYADEVTGGFTWLGL